MNNKVITLVPTFVGLSIIVSLSGCQDSSVKRDPLAPPVSEIFTPSGHLQAKQKVENVVSDSAGIPSLTNSSVPKLPPLLGSSSISDNYSISAVNVPVADLLFKLAKDANKEIDIYSGISGNVTLNAINQPLETILDRISDQVGFMFEIDGNTLKIKPDLPVWRNYKIDYVNIKKKSEETIDMKMTVSSGTEGSTGSGDRASSTKVSTTSEHDFWGNLAKNIELLAQLDPNENKVIVPQGNGQSPGNNKPGPALSSVSQNTVVNAEAGVISVYTTRKQHKAIKHYIDEVTERAQRQVLIEATVVEVVLNDDYQAGIDWSKFGGLTFTSDGAFTAVGSAGPSNILEQLAFLKTFGNSKVLSSPKIMAINNQTALLKVVNNLVYFTVDVNVTATTTTSASSLTTYETEIHTVPVGFTMSITPFVSENGDVTLNVRPTISRKIGEVADPNPNLASADVVSNIPIIQEKEMSSVLRLKDRQTAIIGGLIEDDNANNRTGLPWLSDVPLLGDLFSQRNDSTNKSELVIFIRPVIIKNPDIDNGDLQSVSRFLKTSNDKEVN